MAHTFKQALADAATRTPQRAAYLHALIHATDVDDPLPDQVEWTHDDALLPETCDDGQHLKPTLPL